MQYRIIGKGVKRKVEFACPVCQSNLNSPLVEAGREFPCPTCKRSLTVPGVDELNKARQEERQAAIAAQAERERQAQERREWIEHQQSVKSLNEAAAAPAPLAAPLNYTSPRDTPSIPAYRGLVFGATILRTFALLSYLGGVILLIVVAVVLLGNPKNSSMDFAVALAQIAPALMSLAFGGLLHAAGEACIALRDIARNSFAPARSH